MAGFRMGCLEFPRNWRLTFFQIAIDASRTSRAVETPNLDRPGAAPGRRASGRLPSSEDARAEGTRSIDSPGNLLPSGLFSSGKPAGEQPLKH